MRVATLCCLLALAGAAAALDFLDPSAMVEQLTEAASGLERWHRPEFCGKLDCPPFKRKERTDNWDLRRYDAGKWVVTNVSDTKWELAYTKAASRLLKYFKGGNSEGKTFDVTTPTLGELKLKDGGKGTERDYAFSLWIPEEMQKHAPKPTDAEVKVVHYEHVDVYVRVFGGFATESTVLEQANGLMDMLDEAGRDFADDLVYVAVYDPPQKLMNRHNEVHIPASKGKKEQAVPAS